MKNNKEIETKYDPEYPWANRINQVRKNSKLTQNEFAQKCGLSSGTLSEWIVNKIEPKVKSLKKVADTFGVSMDYLMGKHECKTPENQKISEDTGLTDDTINSLRWANKRLIQKGDSSIAKKLAVCNYLIKTMRKSSLLESLYDYLFGEYFFESTNGENLNGATIVTSRSPNGKEGKSLVLSSIVSRASFIDVQGDLIRLKDEITAEKDVEKKIKEEKWKEENKEKIERDYWDMIDQTETGVDSE